MRHTAHLKVALLIRQAGPALDGTEEVELADSGTESNVA
jgi:hypothetical protein